MKRIITCFLCGVFLLNLVSCDGGIEKASKEKYIAAKYASTNELVAESYVAQGFTKVTYNSSSDVVLAVENGKADYGVLDVFEFQSYVSAGRKIKKKELCTYNIDYCAYFSSDNEALQKLFNQAIADLKADGTLEKIKNAYIKGESVPKNKTNNNNGTLTMLCDPSFENRVYSDSVGSIAGLDVDIACAICNSIGYDLEIVTADFDELFSELDKGEGDFIISACEVTEERAELYLLSDSYFTLDYYLIEKE